eukprot:CAMPEP_0182917204 /NCGR_PEP_ID=MMETSP0105_2-20130417/1383_1 /TAXON_ID=81532 ORGANISM="Acanthoeca-like sp., Strain 10tr" /NCGR_SAMPLE_ID=MMETSP0105_2 /ASSEMBLY_ACC=CAM_ASM_000205 /LENGTH=738 /DNA_ID=CAMNT_0025054195 /DNA_START=233 /DNA_END=2449 /DNA_ORIENTATION=-
MPTVPQYVESLDGLTKFKPNESVQRIKTLLKVLSIGVFLEEMPKDMLEELPTLFRKQGNVFPATDGSEWIWASLDDLLLVNDDLQLGELFKDHRSLHLLQFGYLDPRPPPTETEINEAADEDKIWTKREQHILQQRLRSMLPSYMPQHDFNVQAQCVREATSLRPLLRHLGVPYLSDCVTETVQPQNGHSVPHCAFDTLVDACAVVQRWIYTHDADLYTQAVKPSGVVENLCKVRIVTVDTVVIESRLKLLSPPTDVRRARNELCHLVVGSDVEPHTLYISHEILGDNGFDDRKGSVWQPFVRIFVQGHRGNVDPDELVDFLKTWEGTEKTKRADFLNRKNLKMPDDAVWALRPPQHAAANLVDVTARDDDDGELSNLLDGVQCRETVETFSGGFDKQRRRPPEAPQERAQFPAPQHLEVVVAEEDGRIYGEAPTAANADTNVIYVSTGQQQQAMAQAEVATAVPSPIVDRALEATAAGRRIEEAAAAAAPAPAPAPDIAIGHAADANAELDSTGVRQPANDVNVGLPRERAAASGGLGAAAEENVEGWLGAAEQSDGRGGGMPARMVSPEAVLLELTAHLGTSQDPPEVGVVPAHTAPGADRAKAIGRLGEELAFSMLEEKGRDGTLNEFEPFSAEGDGQWTVRWLNLWEESGEPYDLECTHPSGRRVYVEVKSTASSERSNFPISVTELMTARDAEEGRDFDYVLARVYLDAGRTDLIQRPWKLLESKGAHLFMQI